MEAYLFLLTKRTKLGQKPAFWNKQIYNGKKFHVFVLYTWSLQDVMLRLVKFHVERVGKLACFDFVKVKKLCSTRV